MRRNLDSPSHVATPEGHLLALAQVVLPWHQQATFS